MVGAPYYNVESVGNAGSAFLFEFANNDWQELKDIQLFGEKPIDYFGSSVFIDSLNLVIGARLNGDDKGAAYISKLSEVTSVEEDIPDHYALEQNYPNPFNGITRIFYSIRETQQTKIILYDILGRRVKTLVNDIKNPGRYFIDFNSAGLASGVYLYRLEAGSFISTKKMILLK